MLSERLIAMTGVVDVTQHSRSEAIPMPAAGHGALDAESVRWINALSGAGGPHEDAIARLHAHLLLAARFD